VRPAAVAIAALVLSGCATEPPKVEPAPRLRERVVLLPSSTERPSAVVVQAGGTELVLDSPYASADLRGSTLESHQLTAQAIERRYGELIAAEPLQPEAFTLYFEHGSDELTAASRKAFEDARARIAARSAVEVIVIGHTDRAGSTEYNDSLARRRAQTIATRLLRAGVPSDAIEIAARGEREPIVATPDGVSEPRNRRVEIKVR
jgi:outer membrane protein OmpA-like peptidoglycan-associated protein